MMGWKFGISTTSLLVDLAPYISLVKEKSYVFQRVEKSLITPA